MKNGGDPDFLSLLSVSTDSEIAIGTRGKAASDSLYPDSSEKGLPTFRSLLTRKTPS